MIGGSVGEEDSAARPKAVSDNANITVAKKTVPFLQCSFLIETTLLSDGLFLQPSYIKTIDAGSGLHSGCFFARARKIDLFAFNSNQLVVHDV